MAEKIWPFPLVGQARERLRAMTPGELPPMTEVHPVMGLVHDVERLFRRRMADVRRGMRWGIFGGR